jgi:hypothetical protein
MELLQPDPAAPLAPHIRVGQDSRGSCCWEVVDGDLVVRTVTMTRARQLLAERWSLHDELQLGEGQ